MIAYEKKQPAGHLTGGFFSAPGHGKSRACFSVTNMIFLFSAGCIDDGAIGHTLEYSGLIPAEFRSRWPPFIFVKNYTIPFVVV